MYICIYVYYLQQNMLNKNSYCFLCYSADNIIYTKTLFICKKCSVPIKKCDICGLSCDDKCLELFDKCISISNS